MLSFNDSSNTLSVIWEVTTMRHIDTLKDALTASPDRARELIARTVEAEDVTEAECAELVALALKLGAIKARDLL